MSTLAPETTRVRIEQRDLRVLAGLFECRIMQRRHLTALYFDGKDAMAKERIGKKLLKAGYIIEQNPYRNPSEKAIYGLARRGFEELEAHGLLSRYECLAGNRFVWRSLEDRLTVSRLTVEHELSVMDTKVALTCAIKNTPDLLICEFLTWPLLFQFAVTDERKGSERIVKPDAYLRVRCTIDETEIDEQFFFIERDRGTEIHDTLISKVRHYQSYDASPTFAQFVDALPDESLHFRVLFIFGRVAEDNVGNEERRNNFLHRVCKETTARYSEQWPHPLRQSAKWSFLSLRRR